MYTFKTNIERQKTAYNPQAFYNVPGVIDFDEISLSNVFVHYELEPEIREWGIDCITVSIQRIEATVDWETSTDGMTPEQIAAFVAAGAYVRRDDMLCGTINLDISTMDELDSWELDKEDVEFDNNGAFSIDGIQIDFKDKAITLLTYN